MCLSPPRLRRRGENNLEVRPYTSHLKVAWLHCSIALDALKAGRLLDSHHVVED